MVPIKLSKSLKLKFWGQVRKSNRCWTWKGALFENGYGQLQGLRAHRISWTIHFGKIPEGLLVLHKCDNPSCVNPVHLFLGTHQDNMTDMKSKGRSAFGDRSPMALYPEVRPKGELNGRSKLTAEDVRYIRLTYVKGSQGPTGSTELATKFGVSTVLIQQIAKNKIWTHLTGE